MSEPNEGPPPGIIDLSHSVDEKTPAFPGDPPVKITILDAGPSSERKPRINVSQISLSLHCGTHMDAPFHFFDGGETIDRVRLERCVGPAVLATMPPGVQRIEPEHLRRFETEVRLRGRIVFNTGWHVRWGSREYFTSHPVLSASAARFLVDCGAELVGVDTPSVDHPPFEAHLELLGSGVLIVENLTNLDAIASEVFHLAAIPLKIAGRDGSPVRAIAFHPGG